jgi:hypothetical protein
MLGYIVAAAFISLVVTFANDDRFPDREPYNWFSGTFWLLWAVGLVFLALTSPVVRLASFFPALIFLGLAFVSWTVPFDRLGMVVVPFWAVGWVLARLDARRHRKVAERRRPEM